jgi:putative N6-adenine-specific DNA methylase
MAALFLPCAGGVEALLADEVLRLTGTLPDATRGGVWVEGDERTAMLLNLESRLAQRVLWPLADGPYRNEHDLYAIARSVAWPHWISPEQTLSVDVSAQRSPLHSLNFAALRIKDAVCDALREASGARPSVDTRHPDLPIALFAGPEHATLYVDTSGQALFKRGWRDEATGGLKGEAPLKETLAAAMLAAAGWRGRAEDGALFDPCCGAGTLVIEAAQIACGIAPGGRRSFAFERMLPFQPHAKAWRELRHAAKSREHPSAVAIFAGDVSFRMADFAGRNAARAGVAGAIAIKTADALQRLPPASAGVLMTNPPYGERMSAKGSQADRDGVAEGGRQSPETSTAAPPPAPVPAREGFSDGRSGNEFFAALAAHWKRHYAGWTVWMLSPDMKLPTAMRLKEGRRVPLWNGAIECRLFRFDMVAGAGPGGGAGSR